MGSLGLPEIIFILLLALLIFGPKRLPEIGRTLGKGIAEFRKASNDLKRTINAELSLDADEQTPHPRRIESPVPSIMQAVQGMTPAATASGSTEPSIYHQPTVSPAPWTPQEPPAGTVAHAQISPVPTAASVESVAEAHDPTLPAHTPQTPQILPIDPIEPS
jgi:sec-independent protein translocase protein TatA